MSEWRKIELGRLATKLVNGGTPPTDVPRYWGGKIPWITGADFTESGIGEFRRFVSSDALTETTTNVIERGQLLIVTRTGVGKLAIAPCDIAVSQDITGFYLDEKQVTPAFLYHRMRQGMEDLKKLNQGTSINGVVRGDLIGYPILLPPLPQQCRIAEILGTVDEAIEQTEALIAKQQQVKAGLMHDLFTRGLTAAGQLRPPPAKAPHLYQDSPLGPIPNEWAVCPLGSFAASRPGTFVNGPFGSDLLTSELRETGIPVIYVQDIKEDEYRRVSSAHVSEEKANQLSVCNVRGGDIVVGKVGDPPGLATVYSRQERAIITQDVIRIRPAEDVVSLFLAGMLNSPVGKHAIHRIVIEGTRSRVSLTEFKTLLLPKPDHEEQQLIGDRLEAIAIDLATETAHLAKLRQQKQGLMQDLLTGRVRVAI